MQRCPYLHEMKERLLGQPEGHLMDRLNKEDVLEVTQDPHVGTIVKLNADGYGSHTSPARAPLVSAEECDEVTPAHGHTPAPNHHGHGYHNCCNHGHGCDHGHGDAVHRHSVACSPCASPDYGLPLQPSIRAPKNAKTSLFIIMSFIYAKLLVVICIAYVISDVITHNLPMYYYEGFFTYLYGMSILFLLYVFCFLLQESACCNGSPAKPKPPPKEKKPKKEKEKKPKDKDGKKEGKSKDKDTGKDVGKDKSTKESKKQSQFQQQDIVEVETGITPIIGRRRKTSQNDHSHGSFFLRIGAIAFGLGTMIYNGLEFGTFFEVPFDSQCYQILRGVNPLLQMVFTFMQMYFIFMNSRLNIHRFKVVARFGLMHVAATNLCVWIRTLVLESLKEITAYHLGRPNQTEDGIILESIRRHTLRHSAKFGPDFKPIPAVGAAMTTLASTLVPMSTTPKAYLNKLLNAVKTTPVPITMFNTSSSEIFESFDGANSAALVSSSASVGMGVGVGVANATVGVVCPRINIMGSIVADSAPYLYPFIIEYSLIGAAVIYVMWKHIGRQTSYMGEEELERRLEAVLSRRAAALAAARRGGRVDCAGASKGLFCGLLLLVGALICLILFFVLVRHPRLGILAIYLADVSHCALMALSILAIIIGFIRVQSLKFRSEEQSDLNDILLRVSAFGLFVYSVFSVIAGSLGMFTNDANLLVMITGILCVVQVVLQLLFIADVSRRRVHLPEQERSKPARQAVTFLLICNLTMWMIYTFEAQKVVANPVQLEFYGFLAWSIVQRITLPLCIFHRFHSAVTLAEIWKTSYKARLE